MFKAVKNLQDQKGFTLIELLIVVAIIGILAAVGIPGYIGMQERGRKGAVTRTSESNTPELQAFIISARKAQVRNQNSLVEVDTNGDGVVLNDGSDMNNFTLGTNGPINAFINRHALGNDMAIISPWNSTAALFVDGGVAGSLTACEGTAFSTQVAICYDVDSEAIRVAFIVGKDIDGNIVYSKTITADQ